MKDNSQHHGYENIDSNEDEQPEQEDYEAENMGFDYGQGHRDDTSKDIPETKRDKLKDAALKKYKTELLCPGFDIGRGTISRKNLRMVCKEVVMESSISTKRDMSKNGSISVISAGMPVILRESQNAFLNALRKLQHERLVVARLGFAEKAFELDKVISVMRSKIREERKKEEKQLLQDKMKQLRKIHQVKRKQLEDDINKEIEKMENRFNEEGKELLLRQERDFINLIKGTTRRAIGRVKKCNCDKAYLCRHNKTASYNTRKPSKEVVQYRRNAARLKQGGRPEEAIMWQEKATQLDQKEQEEWRKRVATSIVTAPWGANEAVVDQMADSHRKELQALRETHRLKRTMTIKNQEIRKRNFENLLQAESRKTKMQCLKQAARHATLALSKRGQAMGRPKMTLDGDDDEDGGYSPSGGSQLGSPSNDKDWSRNSSQIDNNDNDDDDDDDDEEEKKKNSSNNNSKNNATRANNSGNISNQSSTLSAKPPATPAPSTPTYRTTTSILKSRNSEEDSDEDEEEDSDSDTDNDSGKKRPTQSSRPLTAPSQFNNNNNNNNNNSNNNNKLNVPNNTNFNNTFMSSPTNNSPFASNANHPPMQIPSFMNSMTLSGTNTGGGLSAGLSLNSPFGLGGGFSPAPPSGGGLGRPPSFMRGFQSNL